VDPYYYPATLDLDTGQKKRLGKHYGGEPIAAGVEIFLWVSGSLNDSPAYMAFPGGSYKKLGKIDFDAVTKPDLQNAQPSANSQLLIGGSGSGGVQVGDVLAILTTDGRYAKLEVTDIKEGGDFWETYKSYDVTVKYVVFTNN
jgi:hypothetical protein